VAELLDAEGHAAERQVHVGRLGLLPGRLRVQVREGVQLAGLDRRERGVELLERRAVLGAEGVDERTGIAQPR
jgi:hypothetical protein